MARGETRFGSLRPKVQQVGTGNPPPHRGGEIGITRQIICTLIPGTAAANAGNYGTVFMVPMININRDPIGASSKGPVWQVTDVRERHEAAGTDAGAVNVMLMKVPFGVAKAAGTPCLATALDLKALPDRGFDAPLHPTLSNYQLIDGDTLALVTTGTLTSVTGVAVTVELKRIG